jgi:VanZ family protein
VAASRRAYAIVFLLVVAFILYGSLYPFQFHARATTTGPIGYLWSTRHDWDHGADLLSNILLYIPFGFFGVRAFSRRGAVPVAVAAAALATGIELAQFYDQGRVTSMGDVYADTIGAGIGAIVAATVGSRFPWPLLNELRGDPPAAIVLLMWFAYRLYPYVPVGSTRKYERALAPVLTGAALPPIDLARFTIAWVCIGAIIDAVFGSRRVPFLLPLLIATELVARILIIDATLKPADIVGAGLAFALWWLLPRAGEARFVIVALTVAGMIVVARLTPFVFEATPRAFGWVPFASFLRGTIGVAMQAFCEKFFQYGALIWLLRRVGLRIGLATVVTATLLFATSWAETYLPGRSAEITDAAMAFAIGGVFALLDKRSCRSIM